MTELSFCLLSLKKFPSLLASACTVVIPVAVACWTGPPAAVASVTLSLVWVRNRVFLGHLDVVHRRCELLFCVCSSFARLLFRSWLFGSWLFGCWLLLRFLMERLILNV